MNPTEIRTAITTSDQDEEILVTWNVNEGGLHLQVYSPSTTFGQALEHGQDPRAAMEALIEKFMGQHKLIERQVMASCELVFPALRAMNLK